MADTVFAESLAYGQMKKRAVSARSYRVKIPPTNGVQFSPGATIQVDLPGNQAGTYYNFNQMYLKVKVTNDVPFTWDRAGALGLIKRLQISTAGAQLCDINNYNVLATALMDTDSSLEYKAGYGALLLGTSGDSLSGKVVTTNGVNYATTYCIPIVLNPLAQTTPHRMIPAFSLSSIQVRLTLDSSAECVKSGGVAFGAGAFSDVELVCMMTELSSDAQAKVDASTGGKYDILATSWMQAAGNKAAADVNLTQNLGFSMSSLERILAIHRPTVGVEGAFSLGNRGTAGLTQYSYSINSEMFPARPIIVADQGAEACAELLVADHSLVDFKKGCGLTNAYTASVPANRSGSSAMSGNYPATHKKTAFNLVDPGGTLVGTPSADGAAAGVDSDIGTFVAGCEFENSLSDGKSSMIYSGISTMSSTVQFLGNYAAGTASNVDFFAQYSVLLSLNMRGSGVYSISL